jgi:hypothetical protein
MGAGFVIDFSYLTLKLAARVARVPMEELAAAAVARDKAKRGEKADAQQLGRILKRLQSYHGENRDRDIADFAHAEVYEHDPLRARRIVPEDEHGVGAAFGRRLERRSP